MNQRRLERRILSGLVIIWKNDKVRRGRFDRRTWTERNTSVVLICCSEEANAHTAGSPAGAPRKTCLDLGENTVLITVRLHTLALHSDSVDYIRSTRLSHLKLAQSSV